MIHISDKKARVYTSLLMEYCSQYHLDVSSEVIKACLQHLDLVIEANQTMNLTRILDVEDALVLHILDSLVLLPYIDMAPQGALLDMGTGAGFPGIPLTLASKRHAVYIDSVGKKINAVNSFIDALGIKHAVAIHERLEEYARGHKKEFAVVTARALAPLPTLIEYAAPFVKDKGLFVITKGNPSASELRSGEAVSKICGFSCIAEHSLDLPNGLGHREFIVLKKTHQATVSLPRANGMAKKNPLA